MKRPDIIPTHWWTPAQVQAHLPAGWRAEPYWYHPASRELVSVRNDLGAIGTLSFRDRTWCLGARLDVPTAGIVKQQRHRGWQERLIADLVERLRDERPAPAPEATVAKYRRLRGTEGKGWAILMPISGKPCPKVGDVVMVRRASDHTEEPQTVLAIIRKTDDWAILAFRDEEAEKVRRKQAAKRGKRARKKAEKTERAEWRAARVDRPEAPAKPLGPEIRHVNRPYKVGEVIPYALPELEIADLEQRQGIAAAELPGPRRRVLVVVETADRDDDGYVATVRLARPEECKATA